jgi:hypothetical protein
MTKNSKGTTRTITTLIAVGLMTIVPLRRAHAGHVTETIVAPVTITNSYSGSINALATKDQIDTQNDSTKYVQFGTPPGSSYQGYFTYSLPPTVNPAQITTLTFLANVLGPSARSDAFTWSIYNWTTSKYESLGNQNVCGGTTGTHPCNSSTNGTLDSANYARWKWLQRMALGRPLTQYVNASGQIQVQLASQNATGYLDVDYAVMDVFTNDGIAGTLWIPPQNYRWQYQLQVSSTGASQYASTEGINVNICVVLLHWRRLCNS